MYGKVMIIAFKKYVVFKGLGESMVVGCYYFLMVSGLFKNLEVIVEYDNIFMVIVNEEDKILVY